MFTDFGESARTTNRPQFREMISFCKRNNRSVASLVVYKLDRFSRNKSAFFAVQATLAGYGIRVVSATEPVDEDSPVGRLLEGILASVGEFESDLIGERVKASMEHARSCGRLTNAPPLGYILGPSLGRRCSVIPDPEMADHIRFSFEKFATGQYRMSEVLDMVTRRGLRNQRGKPVTKQHFRYILRNPTYLARVAISSERGSVQGEFEPLVDEGTFYRVQSVLEDRRVVAPHWTTVGDFPLRRVVLCGKCGAPLTGTWTKKENGRQYGYYWCRESACRGTMVRKDTLEERFVGFLARLVPSQRTLQLLREGALNTWTRAHSEAVARVAAARTRLDDLMAEKVALVRAFVHEHVIDSEAYELDKERIEQEALEVRMRLADDEYEELDIDRLLNTASYVLTNAARIWESSGAENRERLVRMFFPGGILYEDGIFRTADNTGLFSAFDLLEPDETNLARPSRLERETCGLEVRCSIQLSYGRTWIWEQSIARQGQLNKLAGVFRH